ncbi:MAG: L-threonylcarbamoyladenylate synthase [Snowella sp.]
MSLVTQAELIQKAIAGQVVSFPTDTVPGLAVLPQKADLIFDLKQRATDKPLILMAATVNEIWDYVLGTQQERTIWQAIAEHYWPGQLTLVLPASERVPAGMNPLNSGTIGIRIPDSAIALDILAQTGPLATTSANLSGQPPLMQMSAITQVFPDVATLNCDNLEDVQAIGKPSTVIQWTGHGWKTLRVGCVTF